MRNLKSSMMKTRALMLVAAVVSFLTIFLGMRQLVNPQYDSHVRVVTVRGEVYLTNRPFLRTNGSMTYFTEKGSGVQIYIPTVHILRAEVTPNGEW
jgi:hypothetical protein